jgi:hypothetical protein
MNDKHMQTLQLMFRAAVSDRLAAEERGDINEARRIGARVEAINAAMEFVEAQAKAAVLAHMWVDGKRGIRVGNWRDGDVGQPHRAKEEQKLMARGCHAVKAYAPQAASQHGEAVDAGGCAPPILAGGIPEGWAKLCRDFAGDAAYMRLHEDDVATLNAIAEFLDGARAAPERTPAEHYNAARKRMFDVGER